MESATFKHGTSCAMRSRSATACSSIIRAPDPPSIAGIAEVVKAAHPDPTAFDPKEQHFDPKSDRANPTWYQVSIRAVQAIDPPLELPKLRTIPELAEMELLRKGSRLSIQPVKPKEWETILKLIALKTFVKIKKLTK